MHLSQLTVRNFRQFGEGHDELQISFLPGVTALVGRNDSGKSAVIDAVRYVLLTRDQEYIRVQPEDFHIDNTGKQASEIYIVCKLAALTDAEKGAFTEYLSYEGDDVVLYAGKVEVTYPPSAMVRKDAETRLRLARIENEAGNVLLEYSGFVDFPGFIFFAVLLTQEMTAMRNLRKLEYVIEKVLPISVVHS